MTNIEAIVAVDETYGIAKNGKIPWKSKTDMTFFRQKTMNNIIVMGSTTLLSFPKSAPLKDRLNIVLTRNANNFLNYNEKSYDNIIFIDEITLLALLKCPEQYIQSDKYKFLNKDYIIYIIGGKQIYDMFCKDCSTIWLTKIKTDYKCDLIFSKEILNSFANKNSEYEDDELEIIKLAN
jgi:dihydrofolate reductase